MSCFVHDTAPSWSYTYRLCLSLHEARPIVAAQGVKDMVRMSDARMSGTAFGTIVLHISPEAAAGGPLALVLTGDRLRLDTPARRLDLLVSDAELAERRPSWTPPPPAGSERAIGRASCRASVCPYVSNSVVAVS